MKLKFCTCSKKSVIQMSSEYQAHRSKIKVLHNVQYVRVAKLVPRPPTFPKVWGLNFCAYSCFIRALFIWIGDWWEVSNFIYVSYRFNTSNHFDSSQHVKKGLLAHWLLLKDNRQLLSWTSWLLFTAWQ
jgi:hypothetical protein